MSAESKPRLQKDQYPSRDRENEAILSRIEPTLQVRRMMDEVIREYVRSPTEFEKRVDKLVQVDNHTNQSRVPSN